MSKITTPKKRSSASAFRSKNIDAFKTAVNNTVRDLNGAGETRLAMSVFGLAFKTETLAKQQNSKTVTSNHLANAFTSIQRGIQKERASRETDTDNVINRATENTDSNTQKAADILGKILAND